jgi:fructuronate reductase
LRVTDSEIQADADGRAPLTVVGQLVRGMQARQRVDAGPLSVVCCDNLHANGRVLAGLVSDFCGLLPTGEGSVTAEWIASNVSFPSTMVDRIVPATTPADRVEAAQLLGLDDSGVVVAEPFMQWVIEDSFAGARPKWEAAGAILTADVAPYEAMKLRLLNGSHSALAYLGLLAGYDYVADFVGLPEAAGYIRSLMDDDVTPTLSVPHDFDVADYKKQLLRRFANRALGHRTLQIAMDGSQKLPQRLFGVIAEQLARGGVPGCATLAVAAWMRYVSAGIDEGGRAISVDDPLAVLIAERLGGATEARAVVDAMLSIGQVFGAELRDNASLRSLLVDQVESLARKGVLATLRDCAA